MKQSRNILRAAVAGFLAVLVLLPASEAQAKWIWTPETGWMNARAVPKATAGEQFSEGMRLYEEEDYNRAYTVFSMVERFYPESEHVEEADFLRGDCLLQQKYYLKAYAVFEIFLDNYPDSKRRADAIEKEIDIGKEFLAGARKKFVGVKIFPAREKGVEIIERVISHDPFHQRVPEVLMLLGNTRFRSGRYADAKEYYSRIAKEYAESDLRSEAEYQMILCDVSRVKDVAYDTSVCRKIEKMCKRLEAMDDGEIGNRAEQQAKEMRNKMACKDFDTAEFYRKTGKENAALSYYNSVIDQFEDTEWAGKARECIEELSVD